MSTSESLRARAVQVTESHLLVELEDGSRYSALISLFPILAEATPEERADWELIGGGSGIHWPKIDEHISVFSIVYPEQTIPMAPAPMRRHIRRNQQRRSRRMA